MCFYELDFVAVRIFGKGDHGVAMFHGARFANDFSPFGLDLNAHRVNIADSQGDVTKAIPQSIWE